MKLTPQHKQILELLADGQKHCFTVELYMKDDRKRLSELRQAGYRFNEGAGTCTNPLHAHRAKVKLRQLIGFEDLEKERYAQILEEETMRTESIIKAEQDVRIYNKQLRFV
jgi:hypothetical protein